MSLADNASFLASRVVDFEAALQTGNCQALAKALGGKFQFTKNYSVAHFDDAEIAEIFRRCLRPSRIQGSCMATVLSIDGKSVAWKQKVLTNGGVMTI